MSDPCDDNLCDQFCENTNGSYKCSCQEGYILDNDGLTCNGKLYALKKQLF